MLSAVLDLRIWCDNTICKFTCWPNNYAHVRHTVANIYNIFLLRFPFTQFRAVVPLPPLSLLLCNVVDSPTISSTIQTYRAAATVHSIPCARGLIMYANAYYMLARSVVLWMRVVCVNAFVLYSSVGVECGGRRSVELVVKLQIHLCRATVFNAHAHIFVRFHLHAITCESSSYALA